ncbi:MAG: hypothetical protein IJM02_05790 [Clostridia bacterium]|nr:hypothetical protein [Clostridia bacterium]
MKKLLAILLALSMLVAFAACGSKSEPETTEPEVTEEITEEVSEEVSEDASAAEGDTTAVPADASETAAPADADASETDASAADASESETEETTEAAKIPQTTEEIVAYYNAARKATKPAPKGNQTMALKGDITGDGAIGTFSGILTKAANSALSKNSKETDWIPAADHADIKVSDVKSATAKDDGKGNVVITIYFKDQVDGSDGDSNNGGPVARGVGTLGSIDGALNEMGATMTEGRKTVKLTYTDAYVKNVVINQKSGKITHGEWHYLVKIHVGDARAKLGITAHLENVNAQVDYKVVI